MQLESNLILSCKSTGIYGYGIALLKIVVIYLACLRGKRRAVGKIYDELAEISISTSRAVGGTSWNNRRNRRYDPSGRASQ